MPRTESQFRTTVARPRLLHLIDQPTLAPITLITAPAGYGKSTLLDQWAASTPHQVATVQLGQESNSQPAFLRQVGAAIDRAFGGAGCTTDDEPTVDTIVAQLALLEHAEGAMAMVVDDYHLIENRDVHQAMEALIASLPPEVHLILVSRTQPPLALGRLRAYGQMRELTEADLAFSREEVQAVIPPEQVDRLTPEQVERLAERTDGWIAGIRLALASLETRDDDQAEQVIDALATNPWLDEFLVEEVLDTLPEDLRSFVLRSVHLPWLDADLCNHVLVRDDSDQVLRGIRRRILFVRNGTERGTLAYHALFAECVQRIAARSLGVEERQAVRVRAAAWFERARQPELALDQALAAESWDEALRLARDLCRRLMDRDYHHSRLHWLRRLPESLVLADPLLARGYISALQYSGRLREAQEAFDVVEPGWRASGDSVQQAYAKSCETYFAIVAGESERTLRLSYELLHAYPLDYIVERMHAWTAVARLEFHRGNDLVSHHAFRQLDLCRQRLPVDQQWVITNVEPDRANLQALRGNLRTAEQMYRSSLARLPAQFRSYEARLRTSLAAIYLEWNDLERAAAEIGQVEHGLDIYPYHVWAPEALQMVAHVAEAIGSTASVAASLNRLRALLEINGGPAYIDRMRALQATVWLNAGHLGLAREWAAGARLQEFTWVRTYGEHDPRLVLARVDLAQGHHHQARSRLQALIDQATAAKRWAELVPLAMWQVVTCLERDDEAGALDALRTALHHGRRGRFVRSFLTPGYELGPFLRRAKADLPAAAAAWLETVLEQTGMATPVVPEPDLLSEREQAVLQRLGDGSTNREIAAQLYIGEGTVKKHIGAILAKLGAGNRTAAVVIARRQGLIA